MTGGNRGGPPDYEVLFRVILLCANELAVAALSGLMASLIMPIREMPIREEISVTPEEECNPGLLASIITGRQ